MEEKVRDDLKRAFAAAGPYFPEVDMELFQKSILQEIDQPGILKQKSGELLLRLHNMSSQGGEPCIYRIECLSGLGQIVSTIESRIGLRNKVTLRDVITVLATMGANKKPVSVGDIVSCLTFQGTGATWREVNALMGKIREFPCLQRSGVGISKVYVINATIEWDSPFVKESGHPKV
jgi:hypothetical protein